MKAARAFWTSPWAAIRLSNEGVSTVPGQMALQRMPLPTKSIATDLVKPTIAALVAMYAKRFGTPLKPAIDEMLMIEAPPASSIFGRNARIVRYIDVTLRP